MKLRRAAGKPPDVESVKTVALGPLRMVRNVPRNWIATVEAHPDACCAVLLALPIFVARTHFRGSEVLSAPWSVRSAKQLYSLHTSNARSTFVRLHAYLRNTLLSKRLAFPELTTRYSNYVENTQHYESCQRLMSDPQ